MGETQNTERKFKSVNGKPLTQGADNIKFVSASRLNKEGVTGIVAEGIFQGTKMVDGKYGEKPEYTVLTDDGTLLIVSGAGSLDSQMSKVDVGSYVQITYNGKQPMKNGSLAHSFIVGVADE